MMLWKNLFFFYKTFACHICGEKEPLLLMEQCDRCDTVCCTACYKRLWHPMMLYLGRKAIFCNRCSLQQGESVPTNDIHEK